MTIRALLAHHSAFWVVLARLKCYWALIKDLQTGLLVLTAAAGYASACCANLEAPGMLPMLGSLFLAVAGSTVLNMAYDRDIDAAMARTARRPLASGRIAAWEAVLLGAALTAGGLLWALRLGRPFAAVTAAGVVLDVLVYTVWLKRRTPYAIIIGGLAGGMPVLAGRTLALGHVDATGLLLALAVLCWIPTHIVSFQIKHAADYRKAGVPTFPDAYGAATARRLVAASTVLAVTLVLWSGVRIGLIGAQLRVLGLLGAVLAGLVLAAALRPDSRLNAVVFKAASLYMLGAMLLVIIGGL